MEKKKNRDFPYSGIEPGSPAPQADSLPAELPGKSTHLSHFAAYLNLTQDCKSTIFQFLKIIKKEREKKNKTGIFPTQRSNLGLLHCRQILSQLSYQGSPHI